MASPLAKLALEDGSVFSGRGFGAVGETAGEVVFNTSMTGYQEVLTDPSYTGQIVTMTYTEIGNYGINSEDRESLGVQVEGFVVRELNRVASNFRSHQQLDDYLREAGVIGIEGIDTRALVRKLRIRGAMNGVLSTQDVDDVTLINKAKSALSIVGRDLAKTVMPEKPFPWKEGFITPFASQDLQPGKRKHRVVALDFGMKWNILRCLNQIGCDVTVVPGNTPAKDILAMEPDGIFISNGPGDPEPLTYAIQTLRDLIGKKPIFGICLGHQLLGQALGGKTFKLKFGHRGSNQPVLDKRTGKVEITSQNHGFAVDANSLPSGVEATHINLNDQTLEGLRHKKYPVFSVQYHPEASAGPHDSSYLFEEFRDMMEQNR
ncbi:MAG: glutamine-hydrolyzing carbamoyl-phosphate synthase small subunit [Gemmataceae bacterium]|nr:glutamine-hydrolyzing carbamoyl-phosphate synthase small subunit [Gemmataceae bacterium]